MVKTPLGVTIPGVEVHANIIENILDQSYLLRNPKTYILELLFSIIVALLTFVLSQKIKPKFSLSIFFGNILAIIIIGFSFLLAAIFTSLKQDEKKKTALQKDPTQFDSLKKTKKENYYL